ncbi:hypothetical protein Nos7524_3639 [Nostoc sp. PCC 7524]|nr:hypothetical protein Nos7524_3639 [Nostoc sp. PCC 7524]
MYVLRNGYILPILWIYEDILDIWFREIKNINFTSVCTDTIIKIDE